MLRLAAAALLLCACGRKAPSCDDLGGVWTAPANARWMMLDNGATLEAYPLFDDAVAGGAPRVIDLARGEQLSGQMKRRHMRGGDACEARAPVRVTACKGSELQLVLADVSAPLSFTPCAWGQPAPSRVEMWRRP